MEWQHVYRFKRRVKDIETFLVDLAAHEQEVVRLGFKRALSLPSAGSALEGLDSFVQDFSSLRRIAARTDRLFAEELGQLDTTGRLVEDLATIGLKLRVAKAAQAESATTTIAAAILKELARSFGKPGTLFSEEKISLNRTIVNLGRLHGLLVAIEEYLENRQMNDDDYFKPSNVRTDKVAEFIDRALQELEAVPNLSSRELERVKSYLLEAKKETTASSPSWTKIIGALVIVAAIVSGISDASGAAKNIRDALDYILGTSIVEPVRKLLPSSDVRNPMPPRAE